MQSKSSPNAFSTSLILTKQTLIKYFDKQHKLYGLDIINLIILYVREMEIGKLYNQKDKYFIEIKDICCVCSHELNYHDSWVCISKKIKLSKTFIEQFQDKVEWNNISRYQNLSESFINDFQYKVNWKHISRCQKLSKPFIEKFQDKVNWNCVSRCQKLSEPFIEKFQDKVNWKCVSRYQYLSESFIEKFKNKV